MPDTAPPSHMNDDVPDTHVAVTDRAFPRRWSTRIMLGIAPILGCGIGFAYVQRTDIADDIVADYLQDYGVDAQYALEDVGLRRQELTDIVIGPRDAPVLTIGKATIDLIPSFSGVRIETVKLQNVRLFTAWKDGKPDFGSLNSLIYSDDDADSELPDFILHIEDARAHMETPLGEIGLSFAGEGHLKDGFTGKIAAVSNLLSPTGCRASKVSLVGDISVRALRPGFLGTAQLGALQCDEHDISGDAMQLAIDATVSRGLDSVQGNLGLNIGAVRLADQAAVDTVTGSIGFMLDHEQWDVKPDLLLSGTGNDMAKISELAVGGQMAGGWQVRTWPDAQLDLEGQGVRFAPAYLNGRNDIERAVKDTPIGPLAARMLSAINQENGNVGFAVGVRSVSGRPNRLALEDGRLRGRRNTIIGGARRITMDFSGPYPRIAGSLQLQHPDLPQVDVALRPLHNGHDILFAMPIYRAKGAELALADGIARLDDAGNLSIDADARLSGPLPDGYLLNGRMQLAGNARNGRFAWRNGCAKIAIDALKIGVLSLGDEAFRLCPVEERPLFAFGDGGLSMHAGLDGLNIAMLIDGTPALLDADFLELRFPGESTISGVRTVIGTDTQTRIAAGLMTMNLDNGPVGTFDAAQAVIGDIPLLLSDGVGVWQFDDTGLQLASEYWQVSDRAEEVRFQPLVSRNAKLQLKGANVTAQADLDEPLSGREVMAVDVAHDLGAGEGSADLTVRGLRFDDGLQPETVTPLTLGIVANLNAVISGEGRIDWRNGEVTSSGRFETQGASLAAAFGPVENLSGEIVFSDLLGLETAPGQNVRLGAVNPGIEVLDGELRYQLLPDQKMRIEGAQWPLAGGQIILEPTILDLSQEAERQLTFTVRGMNAAQFLQSFDFENLNATGVFDGTLPMVFNQQGGFIRGGSLKVREGGGGISYLGQLSYEDLSAIGNYAFEALRSLQYDSLVIEMDGPLEGEIVTRVNFTGLAQGEGASKNFVTRQIAKLPIEFNVTIRAPFLQLITSARSLYDTNYLQDPQALGILPQRLDGPATDIQDKQDVQPKDSEDGA